MAIAELLKVQLLRDSEITGSALTGEAALPDYLRSCLPANATCKSHSLCMHGGGQLHFSLRVWMVAGVNVRHNWSGENNT